MANYVLSKNNRYYVALESSYGVVPTVSATNRVPGVRLAVTTEKVTVPRPDKTGTRTFLGIPGMPRKITGYEFETSLMAGTGALPPAVGQMVQAALGASTGSSTQQTVTVNGGGEPKAWNIAHSTQMSKPHQASAPSGGIPAATRSAVARGSSILVTGASSRPLGGPCRGAGPSAAGKTRGGCSVSGL